MNLLKNEEKIKSSIEIGDKKISLAIVSSFIVLIIQYFVLITFNILESESASRIQLLSKLLVALIFLYALPTVIKRSQLKLLFVYFIATLIFLVHYLMFPENQKYIRELIFPFFGMCLPALIYSMSIYEWNIFKKIMKKSSIIIFVIGMIISLLIIFDIVQFSSYSMALSYYMLIPTILFIDDLFNRFSFKSIILTVVSLIVILGIGSRGAILCILVFIILKIIRFRIKFRYNELISYSFLLLVVIISYINLNHLLSFIYNFLLNFGIKSRSIELFLIDEVHLSGRDYIYREIVNKILDKPFIGLGLAGDRYRGGYVHNFILEIIAHFGIVIGLIIVILLLGLITMSLLTKNMEKYNMLIIWLSLGFTHLMVSSSYLLDYRFWIFIGLVLNNLTTNRSKKFLSLQKYEGVQL